MVSDEGHGSGVFRKFRDLIMGALSMEAAASVLTRDLVKEATRKNMAHK
jgi:hypothetical protein